MFSLVNGSRPHTRMVAAEALRIPLEIAELMPVDRSLAGCVVHTN